MSSNDNPIVVDPVSETIQSTCSFYRRLADYKRRPEFEASDNQIKVELLYIELFVCFETYQHVRAQSLESLAALERDCQSCESEVNLIQLILGANRNVIGSQIERHLYRTAINLSNAIRLIRWIVNCIQIELALNQYSICESKKVQTIFKQKLTNFLNVKFCLHPFVTLHSDHSLSFKEPNQENAIKCIATLCSSYPIIQDVVHFILHQLIRTLDWNLFDGHSDSSITSNTHFDPNHTDSGTSLPDNLGCINSTEKGCGLSTCETISPESPESIILEAPLLVWMASSTCFTRCQHCARPLSTDGIRLPYLCRNCHSQSYCSKDCARSAWASAHRFQCLTFATFALPLGRIEFDLTAAFRHLTLNCSNQLDQFTRKQTFFKSLGVKERLCFAFASVLETYLIQIWNIDDQIIDLQLLSEWLVRFKIVDNINSFQLETSEPLDHDATTPIGHAIYLYASLLNHSCRPNCSIDFDGTCARVRAQRFIRAGQELTISYLPSHLLIDRCQARTLLKTIFYFDCQCDVCEAT